MAMQVKELEPRTQQERLMRKIYKKCNQRLRRGNLKLHCSLILIEHSIRRVAVLSDIHFRNSLTFQSEASHSEVRGYDRTFTWLERQDSMPIDAD